ncbi:MAG: sensor histidine kinase [Thermoplasmatota archaeon]
MQGSPSDAPSNGRVPTGLPRMPPFGLQVAMSVLVTTVFILWVRGQWGGAWATTIFADVASTAVPLLAAVACFLRARASPPDLRLAWGLLGAACVAWAFGTAVWMSLELSTGEAPATPSWADLGYLLFVPLAVWGATRFGGKDGIRSGDLRPLLDGAIVGASFIFIAFVFGLERIVLESSASGIGLIVNLLYPFGDAMVLGVVLLRLSRAPPGARPALGLLAAGCVLLAIADLWFLVADAGGTYATGGILDAFWVMGFQLIGLAALRPGNVETTIPTAKQTPGLALLPLYPFALASGTACYAEIRDGGQLSDTLFWTALTVVLLVFTRLMVMLLDNVRLTAREEAAVKALEREKAVRVRMMNAITHDMLNAMSPIRLQLHMLERGTFGPMTPKQEKALEMVRRNSEQMARLASDIKEGSNVEEGRLAIRPQPMDLAETVREAAATRQAEANERGVLLQVEGPTSTPVEADSGRLLQVLDNLLSNALKFTPRGGTILVALAAVDGGPTVRITDSGRGLRPDEIARLFQPYSQVHDPNEIKERGTGLGLFISRGILERHGGRIWAESAGHGQGSTFAFSIPLGQPGTPVDKTAPGQQA